MIGPTDIELDKANKALREAIEANISAQLVLQKQEQTSLQEALSATKEARIALSQQEGVLRQTQTIIETLSQQLEGLQRSLAEAIEANKKAHNNQS